MALSANTQRGLPDAEPSVAPRELDETLRGLVDGGQRFETVIMEMPGHLLDLPDGECDDDIVSIAEKPYDWSQTRIIRKPLPMLHSEGTISRQCQTRCGPRGLSGSFQKRYVLVTFPAMKPRHCRPIMTP